MYAIDLNGVDQPVNFKTSSALWISLGVFAFGILVVRMTSRVRKHLRHLTAMSLPGNKQGYFAQASSHWKLKRDILYAPLWKKRHNREFKLSSAISMGTLPSRFHFLLLAVYVLTNLAYMLVLDFQWRDKYALVAELRGRSGVLALANMIPLVVLAGRNNPLIGWLQISFDTYNLLHRWIGRTTAIEILIHTAAWAYVKHAAFGFPGLGLSIRTDPFIGYGLVSAMAMALLFILSPSPLRHAFYETFLNIHILLAAITVIGAYIHCQLADLPQLPWIQAVVCLWTLDRVARFTRLVYCNYAKGDWTTCTVVALPADACRVTLHLPKHIAIGPGSHAYLRFAGINPWESHPFSIAWSASRSELLPLTEKAVLNEAETSLPTDISFIIGAQTGMTRKLYTRALACHPTPLSMKAAFEGPYAGHHSLDSYGHSVLFAGSTGITHFLPYLNHLIRRSALAHALVATRRITLVWIIRDVAQLEWIRPFIDQILLLPGRRDVLVIKVFITQPQRKLEIRSVSGGVQMWPGRPNIAKLLEEEVRMQMGAMCVSVCGPGGLADNVREAVRANIGRGNIEFIEESFTW